LASFHERARQVAAMLCCAAIKVRTRGDQDENRRRGAAGRA